jgi:uncharacterized protein with PQ loop repeat
MFTQFLGTAATVYGVLAALKSLLQTRQMLAPRTSREVSPGFLASYAGGYAIWLAYGLTGPPGSTHRQNKSRRANASALSPVTTITRLSRTGRCSREC